MQFATSGSLQRLVTAARPENGAPAADLPSVGRFARDARSPPTRCSIATSGATRRLGTQPLPTLSFARTASDPAWRLIPARPQEHDDACSKHSC